MPHIEDTLEKLQPIDPKARVYDVEEHVLWTGSPEVEYLWRSTISCRSCFSDQRQTHFGWGTVCYACGEKDPDEAYDDE